MDHATATSLIGQVLSQLEAGQPREATVEVETHWPVELYIDDERFEREAGMVAACPTPVAHSSQLASPGDFVTAQAGTRSIVIVRGESGDLRAFLNVCRHRGSQLVTEPCGSGLKSFVCPYHAWTYDLDGRLSHVPDRERSFPTLDVEERGLREVAVEDRHGLVWVTPGAAPDEAPSVAEHLGDEFDAELAGFGMGDFFVYKEDFWSTEFNWKCGTESFLENYHFNVLHRDSTSPIFFHNLGFCDQLGRHFRAIAPKKSMRDLQTVDEAEWDIRPHATLLYVIFPSTCVFVEKNHFNILQLLPTSTGTTAVHALHLVQRLGPRLSRYWDMNIEVFMSAVREDFDVCESMQRGYASGANDDIVFGRVEYGCNQYRQCIEDALSLAA
jgi:phenylpropionate dioxygenase-like ring-hydroxylating dioxygenase large terminal subunit